MVNTISLVLDVIVKIQLIAALRYVIPLLKQKWDSMDDVSIDNTRNHKSK